jgi:hypothetical protein
MITIVLYDIIFYVYFIGYSLVTLLILSLVIEAVKDRVIGAVVLFGLFALGTFGFLVYIVIDTVHRTFFSVV